MSPQDSVTLFVEAGDPACEAARRWLTARGVDFTTRDVKSDPAATAVLFGRLGKIVVPAIQIGDKLIVGFDPIQLAKFLPVAGDVQPVAFGAAVRGVTQEFASQHGLPAAFGVEVGPVKEGSPAADAGIRPGDVITAVGSYTLTGGADQFSTAIAARRPGDTMTLTVWRDGDDAEVPVQFPADDAGDDSSPRA